MLPSTLPSMTQPRKTGLQKLLCQAISASQIAVILEVIRDLRYLVGSLVRSLFISPWKQNTDAKLAHGNQAWGNVTRNPKRFDGKEQ